MNTPLILSECGNPYDDQFHADEILEEWDKVCNELAIPHFLVWGTCFGFYFENNYVEGDDDIDLGVKCTAIEFRNLTNKLSDRNFKISAGIFSELGYNYGFIKYGIRLDVWTNFSALSYPFLETFKKLKHNKRYYYIPNNTDKYLDTFYSTWKMIDLEGNHYRVDKDKKTIFKTPK